MDDSTRRLTSGVGLSTFASVGVSPRGPKGAGVLLTGQFGLGGLAGDLYAHMPRSWVGQADAGVGAYFGYSNRDLRMVYAMYGQRRPAIGRRSGRPTGDYTFYIAPGVAWVGPCVRCFVSAGAPGYMMSATTLGIEFSDAYKNAGSVYLTVLLGRQQRTCISIAFGTKCGHALAIVGMSMGFPLRLGILTGFPDPFPSP